MNDIQYSPVQDPFRTFDLHFPKQDPISNSSLVCFIHGGAWRGDDKSNHTQLALKLADYTHLPVAVPNYRLTPNPANHFRHPGHAQDILEFLSFLTQWKDGPVHPTQIYLIGQSCGAHMLSSIFLDSSTTFPSLSPSPAVLHAVHAIIMSEGIYDLDALLLRFPDYKPRFIAAVFGDHESYAHSSVTSLSLRPAAHNIRWMIIHSKGDTLVDLGQSQAMYDHLSTLGVNVQKSLDQLQDEHDDILNGDEYIQVVGDFISLP